MEEFYIDRGLDQMILQQITNKIQIINCQTFKYCRSMPSINKNCLNRLSSATNLIQHRKTKSPANTHLKNHHNISHKNLQNSTNANSVTIKKKQSLPSSHKQLSQQNKTNRSQKSYRIHGISPEFILHEMERNIQKLKDIYTSKQKCKNVYPRQCISSIGQISNGLSYTNNHSSYTKSHIQQQLQFHKKHNDIGKQTKKHKDVIPSVPRGNISIRSSFDEKQFLIEHLLKQEKNKKKPSNIVKDQCKSKSIKNNKKIKEHREEGNNTKKQSKSKSKQPINCNQSLNKKPQKKSTAKTKPKKDKVTLDFPVNNQQDYYIEETIIKSKPNSNKNSSTKIYGNSPSINSPQESPVKGSAREVKEISSKDKYRQNQQNKGNPDNIRQKHQDLNFLTNCPEIQISMFDNNMPIIEVEDSNEQMSSIVMDQRNKKLGESPILKKYVCKEGASDKEEEDSLAGCSIPKISEDALQNYELVSFSL